MSFLDDPNDERAKVNEKGVHLPDAKKRLLANRRLPIVTGNDVNGHGAESKKR